MPDSQDNKNETARDGTAVAPPKAAIPPKRGAGSPESRMEILVGYILLIGVVASITLIAAGVIWHYAVTRQLGLDYSISGMNLFHFVLKDFARATHPPLRPRLFVNLGIAVLMLTPYVRVAASMFFFAFAEKNTKYTVFTALVFCVLTYSLFLR